MSNDFISTLLRQSESETLDFKREQYAIAGADKPTKSEFLKDILAFANAWKTADAHILVGVEENPTGGKAKVVGVPSHLDDADLQQLVNSKTNRPIKFNYRAMTVEGHSIGVITIDCDQDRPLYCTKDFGNLKQGVVKIRRGSSTADASPDEIAEMGAARIAVNRSAPRVELQFADTSKKRRLGHSVTMTPVRFIGPPEPQYESEPETTDLVAKLTNQMIQSEKLRQALLTMQTSPSPFGQRERTALDRFRWRQEIAQMCAVGFWAKNCGDDTLADARVVIKGASDEEIVFWDDTSHPNDETSMPFGGRLRIPTVADVNYHEHGDEWTIDVSLGKLQPKADTFAGNSLYIGSLTQKTLQWKAHVYADHLSDPIEIEFRIEIEPIEVEYSEELGKAFDECRCFGFAEATSTMGESDAETIDEAPKNE